MLSNSKAHLERTFSCCEQWYMEGNITYDVCGKSQYVN